MFLTVAFFAFMLVICVLGFTLAFYSRGTDYFSRLIAIILIL